MSGLFCETGILQEKVAHAEASDSWYDIDWSYRKEISIDHAKVAEDLTDYPLLFSVVDNNLKSQSNGGKAGKEDGVDILFTSSDGTTKLSHEIEEYVPATGELVAWVKVPFLSSSADTKLYVYYGNAGSADQQAGMQVWDAGYKMVQHMDETPANGVADGHLDSTSNAMNGTADRFYSTATTNAQGKIGGADTFKDFSYYSGYPDYADIHKYSRVSLPSTLLGSEESFTVSSWVKPNAAGAVFSNNGGEIDYCGAPGYAYYAYYLRNVSFNTINNSSSTFDSIAYHDYNNISTNVQVGQTYTLATTNAPYMHHYIKAWFDFNQDGDFSDAGEEFVVTTESSYQVGHSISVTIPTTALNGPTRMRVRAIENYSQIPTACGYEWYTETEDYTINVQGSAYNKTNAFSLGTFGTSNVGKFTIIKNGVAYDVSGDSNINDGAWHYMTASYGTDGMKLYIDGVLKGTNNTITGALSPLGSGFWIGRYYDDRKGQYGFDGTIDEVRVSTSVRGAGWIQTEYANQSSPSSFYSIAGSEARIMDHFSLSSDKPDILNGDSVTLTISAINNMGEIFLNYDGDKTFTFSGAQPSNTDNPSATDKNGTEVDFGGSTVVHFTDGIATTTLTLYKAETADIGLTDGSYQAYPSLQIEVKANSVFLAPVRPVVSGVVIGAGTDGKLDISNLPASVSQVAISASESFDDASWVDIKDIEALLEKYEGAGKLYIKFRSKEGAVSEIRMYEGSGSGTIEPNDVSAMLNDGDIVKTADNPDVYIIKYKNGKKYKRLILSPDVFKSYGHLKWPNLKIVTRSQIDAFTTSNLVQVAGDTDIYELASVGDTGRRKRLDIAAIYDLDSVYEINATDRDSYVLE